MRKIAVVFLLALLLAGCDVFDKTAEDEYETAMRRWNAGDYATAVRMYYAIAKEHPYSSRADDALYWAGVTQFLYLGKTETALETLRLLIKRYPRRDMAPRAQWYIAQIYELGYDDYGKAAEEYRKAILYADPEVREKASTVWATACFASARLMRHGTPGPDKQPNSRTDRMSASAITGSGRLHSPRESSTRLKPSTGRRSKTIPTRALP